MQHVEPGYQRSHGRIDRLEVENFKSYRGHQHIGPFKDFTAVIGPNGSGKSNLMDAISFVLGVRTTQLRGAQLKELLYSNSGTPSAERPKRGLVSLVFVLGGEEDGQDAAAQQQGAAEEVVFSRHIQPSSSEPDASYQSVYKINGRTVTWEAYSARLSSFGILVKVRNFLVFQGDIEAVAAKSPSELTHLFEQISGSEVFKRQYEELQKAQAKAEEKVALVVGKKRTIAAEKRQKKEQKDEAERHLAKQEQLRTLKSQHLLFQLYHLHIDREAVKKAMRKKQQEEEAAAARSRALESEVDGLKKKAGGLAKERLQREQEMKKLQAKKDKKTPAMLSAKEEMARVAKRIKSGEKEVAELGAKAGERKKALAKLEKELAKVKEAQAALDRQVEERYHSHASKASKMGAAEVAAEYQAIKAEVAAKTSKVAAECEALKAKLQAEEKALASAQSTQRSLQERAAALRAAVAEQRQQAAVARGTDADTKKEVAQKKAEVKQLQDANRRASSERQVLEARLQEVEAQLSDARADRRESQRERKMAEAVDSMRRLFAGVHGRLTELGEVPQRTYKLALAVAMGKDVDSVVVDTEKVAMECIQYLKDQKLPPMTFIPLATCKVKPINERLRTLGGTAKLALDLIQYDAAFTRAFQFVFENTLVCDTAAEGRQWAYGQGERHKVVSKDGVLINKAGLITGGSSAQHDARANRWDDGGVTRLKEQREELERRLAGLPSMQGSREREAVLVTEIQGAEARLTYAGAEAKQAEEKARKQEVEAAQMERDAAARQPDVDRLAAAVAERSAAVEVLRAKVNAVADKLFAPFSKRVGVASIREWEEQHAEFEADVAKRRAELEGQRAKVEGQIGYEKGRDLDGPADRRKAEVEKDKALLAELEGKVAATVAGLNEVEGAMRELQSAQEAAGTEADKVEADLKEARKRGGKLAAEVARLGQEVARQRAAAEQAATRARDILAGAQLEQVELPRKVASAARRKSHPASAMEVDGDEDGNADEEDDEEEARAADKGAGTSAAGAEGEEDVDAQLQALDYGKLTQEQRVAQEPTAREVLEREFAKSMTELAAELERSAPNMKALEQYEAVRDKEREQAAALEDARREAHAAAQAFDAVRQGRYDAFTAAFRHVAAAINDIYQDLTRSTVHKLGGTAYLSVENEEQPYLYGIKYTAMPPTKRFRDMEQLSGGEKTLASLALLFAIHSYRPSPFFVLDEVDAALDATNVARVAQYIRTKTRRGGFGGDQGQAAQPFQSIVISLKDIFYEKADALVGVARDGEQACSRTFTFDLNRFEPPSEAEVA